MAELETMLTLIVREADKTHERVGGGTKHWVRDCFAPALENFGLTFITLPELELMRHELTTLRAENERLRNGISAISDLMDESHGVYGLHLNGDPSPWSELRTGGRFEDWLVKFDDALDLLTKDAARQEEG